MTKYTDIEIMFFRAVAWSLKLAAPPEFFDWPIDTLQGICNGVGGEGSALTPALTWAYRNYQATAAIHDLRYHLGGSEADRERADREFLSNARREWRDVWGWLGFVRPAALRERGQITLAYHAIRAGGKKYWVKRGPMA